MHVVNNDALSHQNKSLEKCLQTSEKEEERNYLEACLPQRRHFYPFLISVDSLLGLEAEDNLKRIDSRFDTNWKHPYSGTCSYVNRSFMTA